MKPRIRDVRDIREIEPRDFDSILKINQHSLPGVSELSLHDLQVLHRVSEFSRVIELEENLVGYIFAIHKGQNYDGDEY